MNEGPQAVALLRAPWKALARGCVAHEDDAAPLRLFANDTGQLFGLQPVRGGTLLHSFLPFFTSADELSLGLGQLLGNDKLSGHDDPRGVLVMPDHRVPDVAAYDAIVSHAAPEALWVPIAAPEQVLRAVELRTRQVLRFMEQMAALNQAEAEGDAKAARAAKKAAASAFSDRAPKKRATRKSKPKPKPSPAKRRKKPRSR